MKNYVLFDFDGTVFDSAEGITKSVQYALGKMGIHAETSELMCFAGPPLDEMFAQRYGMDAQTAHRAVEYYRERYTPVGWEECSPFPGMHELMGKLHAKGIKLAVATSKPRVFAQKILEKHNYIAELLISLGVSEETAYEDSCKIEHDISEESFMALKKLSGILADKTNN